MAITLQIRVSGIGKGDLSGWCLGVQLIWVPSMPSLRSTAPKGTRQNDSSAQRIGNYFYFVALVQWRIQRRKRGGGMGPCLSPVAPIRAYPLGHQPRTLFGLERAIPKGPILLQMGSFWCQETVLTPVAHSTQESPFYTEKREIPIFCGTFSSFRRPSSASGGSEALRPSLKQVLDPPMPSYPVS